MSSENDRDDTPNEMIDNVNPVTGEVTNTLAESTNTSPDQTKGEYQDGSTAESGVSSETFNQQGQPISTPQGESQSVVEQSISTVSHTTGETVQSRTEASDVSEYYPKELLKRVSQIRKEVELNKKKINELMEEVSSNLNKSESTTQNPSITPEQSTTPERQGSAPDPESSEQAIKQTPLQAENSKRKRLTNQEKEEGKKNVERLDKEVKDKEEERRKAAAIMNDSNMSYEERRKAFEKVIASEKSSAILKEKITETKEMISGLTPIPLPMKEVMKGIFDEEYRVKNEENKAFEYATKEEIYYENAKRRRIEQLRNAKNQNFTEEEIQTAISLESSLLREAVQSSLKRKITNDIKERTIKLIESDSVKYKDFIDPKTGKVIDSILKDNLTGKILAERVWPKWYSNSIKEQEKEKEQEEDKKPRFIDKLKEFAIKRARLIGMIVGFGTTAIAGAGLAPAILGGAFVASVGTYIVNKGAEWRISNLTKQLANAQTSEQKAALEAKLKTMNNIRTFSGRTLNFIGGFVAGGVLGLGVSHFLLGGKGLFQAIGGGENVTQGAVGNIASESASGTIQEGNIASEATSGTIQGGNIAGEAASGTIQGSGAIPTIESGALDLGNTFNSGLTFQEASQLGWRGTELSLTNAGGNHGLIQGDFFNKIYDGLGNNLSSMQGFEAANAYNPFLRAAVGGRMSVEEAARQAVQAIQALP